MGGRRIWRENKFCTHLAVLLTFSSILLWHISIHPAWNDACPQASKHSNQLEATFLRTFNTLCCSKPNTVPQKTITFFLKPNTLFTLCEYPFYWENDFWKENLLFLIKMKWTIRSPIYRTKVKIQKVNYANSTCTVLLLLIHQYSHYPTYIHS